MIGHAQTPMAYGGGKARRMLPKGGRKFWHGAATKEGRSAEPWQTTCPGGTPPLGASLAAVEGPVIFTMLPMSMAALAAPVPLLKAGQSPEAAPCGGTTTPPPTVMGSLSSVPVLIRGLPNSLCNTACMEVVLENAGLEASFVGFDARPGETNGEAVVYFKDRSWAQLCVEQFEGRVFNNNARGQRGWDSEPVQVKILDAEWSTPKASPEGLDADEHASVPSRASADVPSQVQDQDVSSQAEPGASVPKTGSYQDTRHGVGTLAATPCSRRVSWADVSDDEEESTCSGTNEGGTTAEEGFDMTENGDADARSNKGGLPRGGDDAEQSDKRIALYVPFAEKDQFGELIHISTGLKFSTKRTFIDFSLPSAGVPARPRRAQSAGTTSRQSYAVSA